MQRKRGVAKRKPKVSPLTPKVASNNTNDQWNLDDGNDNELNDTTEIGGLQNQRVVELAAEDSVASFPGLNAAVSTTSLGRRTRSQMNKSSKALSSTSTKQISNAEKVQNGETHQRGLELPYQDPQYKEEELKLALEVIRKVMKMDAAEPFNVPVDPVAHGVPDYFDIIDTPMDFGTICYNIEYGIKYKNSKDVMRDVQYIWDNCSKYNKKGHYMLELMKRVKTNFTKHWMEAGLYWEEIHDTRFLTSKPTTMSSINRNRSPLAGFANYARSLQQDRDDVTRSQPEQPPSACTESYKSQKRPDHYQLGSSVGCVEATVRQNPDDRSVNPLDYSFSQPQPRQNPNKILQSQSSLWNSEPFKQQERSFHGHSSPLRLQPSHQQTSTFIANAGHPRTAPLNEPTIRGYPYAHRYLENQHVEYSSCSHQNKLSHQSECHDHRPLRCSQPYQSQREFCRCIQCSGVRHPFEPFAGIDHDNEEEYLSSHPSESFRSVAKRGSAKYNAVIEKQFIGRERLDEITPNHKQPDKPNRTQMESNQGQNCSQPFQPFAGVDDDNEEEYFSSPPSESFRTVAKRGSANYTAVIKKQCVGRERLDEITPNQTQPVKPNGTQLESNQGQNCSQPFQPFAGIDDDIEVEEYLSSSPSESFGTVAKHGSAKYNGVTEKQFVDRDQPDEITPNQTQPDKPNGTHQESNQGQNCSQPQTVSNKARKKRGPAKYPGLTYTGDYPGLTYTGDKILITTNEDGEPIGPEAAKLSSFLGVIVRNGHITPLNYIKWKAIPEENKEDMWQLVQSKFYISPESRVWVFKSLKRKWASWKSLLKANHYNPHDNDEDRLADCDPRVLPEQWRVLVEFWNSPEAQAISNLAKAKRSNVKLIHSAGSKSFARLREEERQKRPDGKELSQADLFILTRTRKNGQPNNEVTSAIISQLRDAAHQQQGTSQQDTIEDEVFFQVMGEGKGKRKKRSGPGPMQFFPPEAQKIISESKAEVLEMKEKIVAVEQTCAQIATQVAAMMSMMQKKFAATGTSDLDASLNSEESEHVSVPRSGVQTRKRPATRNGKKHSAGKV